MAFGALKLGGWAFGEILTSAQMNTLNDDHPNAIDGLDGGSYTLTAPLEIGGDTVTIDDLEAGDLTVTGATTLAAASVTTLTASNDVVVSDDLTVGDDAAVGGNLTVSQGSVFDTIQFKFLTAAAPDADTVFGPSDAGKVYFIDSQAASRAYTFVGAFTAGQWFLFKHRATGGFTSTIAGQAVVIQQAILLIYSGGASAFRAFLLNETFA